MESMETRRDVAGGSAPAGCQLRCVQACIGQTSDQPMPALGCERLPSICELLSPSHCRATSGIGPRVAATPGMRASVRAELAEPELQSGALKSAPMPVSIQIRETLGMPNGEAMRDRRRQIPPR